MIDASLHIDPEKFVVPGQTLLQKFTVYEVKPHGGSKDSFVITATSKYDTKTLGGSSPGSHSKLGSGSGGSSDERGTA
jgi:hypothetical protein